MVIGIGYLDEPWDVAAQFPGAQQVGWGKALFERYDWWRLEPHPEWVEPHWTPEQYRLPFAAYIPGELAIVYVPTLIRDRRDSAHQWISPSVGHLDPVRAVGGVLVLPSTGHEEPIPALRSPRTGHGCRRSRRDGGLGPGDRTNGYTGAVELSEHLAAPSTQRWSPTRAGPGGERTARLQAARRGAGGYPGTTPPRMRRDQRTRICLRARRSCWSTRMPYNICTSNEVRGRPIRRAWPSSCSMSPTSWVPRPDLDVGALLLCLQHRDHEPCVAGIHLAPGLEGHLWRFGVSALDETDRGRQRQQPLDVRRGPTEVRLETDARVRPGRSSSIINATVDSVCGLASMSIPERLAVDRGTCREHRHVLEGALRFRSKPELGELDRGRRIEAPGWIPSMSRSYSAATSSASSIRVRFSPRRVSSTLTPWCWKVVEAAKASSRCSPGMNRRTARRASGRRGNRSRSQAFPASHRKPGASTTPSPNGSYRSGGRGRGADIAAGRTDRPGTGWRASARGWWLG